MTDDQKKIVGKLAAIPFIAVFMVVILGLVSFCGPLMIRFWNWCDNAGKAFWCTLFVVLLLPGECWSEWYAYSPAGSVDGKGILQEVVSRCSPQYRPILLRTYSDPVSHAHEGTHEINSQLGKQVGTFGFYVGEGRAFVGREPRISREHVIACVTKRGPLYQHYFNSAPLIQTWRYCRLYALDEWVAATNGAQAAKELGISPGADLLMAVEFCEYGDAVVRAVRRFDPGYQQLNELAAFVEWHKARVKQLAGSQQAPSQPPGPTSSWSTRNGYAWNGEKWRKPTFGTPHYPARPVGDGGLWCDGVPYDSPVSRLIQQREREAYDKAQFDASSI